MGFFDAYSEFDANVRTIPWVSAAMLDGLEYHLNAPSLILEVCTPIPDLMLQKGTSYLNIHCLDRV